MKTTVCDLCLFIKSVVKWSENSARFEFFMGIAFQMGQILRFYLTVWHLCLNMLHMNFTFHHRLTFNLSKHKTRIEKLINVLFSSSMKSVDSTATAAGKQFSYLNNTCLTSISRDFPTLLPIRFIALDKVPFFHQKVFKFPLIFHKKTYVAGTH